MTRRKLLHHELTQSSVTACGQSAELCFKILYGLPADLQISLGRVMMSRYLPIFESKWEKIKWPRQILSDVARWASIHDRDVPEEPEAADGADAAFSFAFDGLLLAYGYQQNDFTLTSSSVFAIDSVINGQREKVAHPENRPHPLTAGASPNFRGAEGGSRAEPPPLPKLGEGGGG